MSGWLSMTGWQPLLAMSQNNTALVQYGLGRLQHHSGGWATPSHLAPPQGQERSLPDNALLKAPSYQAPMCQIKWLHSLDPACGLYVARSCSMTTQKDASDKDLGNLTWLKNHSHLYYNTNVPTFLCLKY